MSNQQQVRKIAGSDHNVRYFYDWLSRVGYENQKIVDGTWSIHEDPSMSLVLARIVLHYDPNDETVSTLRRNVQVRIDF